MPLSDKRKGGSSSVGKQYSTETISGARKVKERQQYADAMKGSRLQEVETSNKRNADEKKKQDAFNDTVYGGTNKLKETLNPRKEFSTLKEKRTGKTVKAIEDVKHLTESINKMGMASTLSSRRLKENEEKAYQDSKTPYEKWYQNNVANTKLGKALGFAQKADRVVSDIKSGVLDTASIGATQGLGREAIKNIPGGEDNLQPLMLKRLGSTAYKAGQIGGYIAPGVVADRLVAKVGGEALKKLPNVLQGLIRGSTSGALDTAAQEGGDVAFRKGSFDPENVALGAGIGGGLGGGIPLIANTVKAIGKMGTQALLKPFLNEATGAVPTPSKQASATRGLGIIPNATTDVYDALRTDTKSQIVSKLKREPLTPNAGKAYTTAVDDLHPLNEFDKAVKKLTGDLKPSESSHMLALGSRGSDIISNQILTDKLVDSTGNIVGKSLKDILSQVPKKKGSYVDLEDYLLNKHAITRAARGERVYDDAIKWTPEMGAAKISQLEEKYPQFKQMADEIYEFQGNMMQKWLVDTGMMTKEQAEAYVKANPTYIPMKRSFTELEKGANGTGARKGFGNQSAPIKSYSKKGSTRKVISPLESMIENVDAFVKTAKRAQPMQAVVRNLSKNPEELKGFAEIVEQPKQLDNFKDIDVSTPDGLDEMMARFNDDFNKAMKRTSLDKDNIIGVPVDGKIVHIKINDPSFLEAVTALGPENLNWLVNTVGQATRTVKMLTTGANPIFSLTRNIFRDIPLAYIGSKTTNNPIRFGFDLLHGIASTLKNGELYRSFKNVGGGHSSPLAADRNMLAQSKRSILPQHKLKGFVPKAYGKLENFTNAIESAPRLGEFKRITKKGGNSPDSKIKGLFEANDITVNFKRRGKISPNADAFVMYLNAAIQGIDKSFRILKDNPIAATSKALQVLTLPTIGLWALNHNNPDYQRLSKHTKDNFMLVPTGNEEYPFVKIAKPQGPIGVLFSTAVERALNHWVDKDPEAFDKFSTTMVNQFLPAGVNGLVNDVVAPDGFPNPARSTILGPIGDVVANKNFMGASIVPGYLEGYSPKFQYDNRTSEVSKFIGDKLNKSPKKLDHIIKSYTGVIGQLGIPATSEGGTLKDTLLKQVTADPIYSNDSIDAFYNNKSKLDKAKKDEELTGKLPSWYSDDLRKEYGKISRDFSDLRKEVREIEKNDFLSKEEKKNRMRDLQLKMVEMAEEINKRTRR